MVHRQWTRGTEGRQHRISNAGTGEGAAALTPFRLH